ncbi:MAG: two-component regulator propeller domain-containing protein [candidate division KSB1 bacterium]|nr:two-component regulator propeller domain-containing protein [candidate division KSB1 bacterium]
MCFTTIRWIRLTRADSIPNSVYSIYKDRSGNIWVGTFAGGINLMMRGKAAFQHYKHIPGRKNGPSHNMVTNFLEDERGQLWIGTDGGGLNVFDPQNKTFKHYTAANSNLSSDVILSLFQNQEKQLWVGTWADGLYRFDPNSGRVKRFTRETHALGSNNIFDIESDFAGNLWMASFWGGLTFLDPTGDSTRIYRSENSNLSDDDVRVICRDHDGTFWVGTDAGLDHFDPVSKKFVNYQHEQSDTGSLSKGFVLSILVSRDSTLWVGTIGGLNRFDRETGTFEHYTVDVGLPNDEIRSIVEDNDGMLWLGTNKGLSRFNPVTETFVNYDMSDGLRINEFSSRSSLLLSNGSLVFGGNNGFNMFQPKNLERNSFIPPVLLTDFRIFNESVEIGERDSLLQQDISETRAIELSYRHSVFSFDFVALNYISPEKNQYAYMMQGFESSWNYVGSRRTATYTNLDPGRYVFKVKASNNDGIWNETGASVNILIHPPFWKTWWAYLIEALLVLALISFVLNYFISRQRLRHKLKMEHLELEKMYELDQIKTHFFTNISHEFHSPLTLIIDPLEKIVKTFHVDEKLRNSLELIHRNARRLQRMTRQLMDFQKLETGDLQLYLSRGDIVQFVKAIFYSFADYASQHQITFKFESEIEDAAVWFDPDKLDKVVYNLLSNAFKFTPDGGTVRVGVSLLSGSQLKQMNLQDKADRYIEIQVQDNGIGIAKDQIDNIFKRFYQIDTSDSTNKRGIGIGLAFIYEILRLYQGDISVDSEHQKGTTFTVRIPVDEHYLEENQLVGEFKHQPMNDFYMSDLAGSISKPSKQNGQPDAHKGKEDIPSILIVEDDMQILDYIQKSLQSECRIYKATNGEEGLEKGRKNDTGSDHIGYYDARDHRN